MGKPPRAEQPRPQHPGTWVATALRPTATVREQRPQPTARAEETRRLEASDDARPYLPNSRRAGIMDASSNPWSPMVTRSGSQNSRHRCRASPQPPLEERAERRRGTARSKTPTGSRCWLLLGPGENPGGDRGGADSGRTRPLFLPRECGCFCSNLDGQRSRTTGSGLERDQTTQQS